MVNGSHSDLWCPQSNLAAFQPRNAVPRRIVKAVKSAADQHFSSPVNDHPPGAGLSSAPLHSKARVKAVIQATICVQTGDAVPGHSIHFGERPRKENTSVRLERRRPDGSVQLATGVERGIEATAGIEAHDRVEWI